MKKFTLALAAFLGLTILAPTTAEAGHNTRVSVDHCGYTVYSEYRFAGRDCHGCPIYRWVVVRRTPPCDRGYASHGDDHYQGGHGGHSYGGHSYGGHSYGGHSYGGHSYGGHRGGYSSRRGGVSAHWSR